MRDGTRSAHAEAIRIACREAWRFGLSRRALALLVDRGETKLDRYSRALHVIERRQVVRETAPASRAKRLSELPDPTSVDPWACDLAELPSGSYVTSICPRCSVSERTGFFCETCAERTRVHAWLDVRRSTTTAVCFYPRTAGASVHPGQDRAADLDARSSAELVEDSGVGPPRDDLPPELQPRLNPVTDRILSTRIQTFETTTVRLSFSTSFAEGFIDVAGEPARVAPTSRWGPLERRRLV